jgi:hypothetical protein
VGTTTVSSEMHISAQITDWLCISCWILAYLGQNVSSAKRDKANETKQTRTNSGMGV